MRWGVKAGVAAAAVAFAMLLVVPASPAAAATNARFGIQDDAWLLDGPGTLEQRLATLQQLGPSVVRFTLRWDAVAPTAPANPADPNDPAYDWGLYGDVLDGLHAHGMTALVTLYGTPRWANGGHGPNWLPTSSVFGDFATAAALRFPWVHMWTVWNEPNGRTFSVPVSPSLYTELLLNPAYAALHAASRLNLVAGGVTSPRATQSGMAPLAFMIGMHAAHARLDAYAQNPYPMTPRAETPFHDPCPRCGYFTLARIGVVRADVTRYFGHKPIWLTEYGYQTNPPDFLLGVSDALQARYVGEAALRVWEQPGVTVLIHFLLKDEPSLGGWQSGLEDVNGRAKPAYYAFALPLAERSRRGDRTVLWGQVRPGSGRRVYQLQLRRGRRWVGLGGRRRTGASGTFQRTVRLGRGAQVRVWDPAAQWVGPPLVVS